MTRIVGADSSVIGLGLLGVAAFGGDPVPFGIAGGLTLVIGVIMLVVDYRKTRSSARNARRVKELATRGVRRAGYVRDAHPHVPPHGDAVLSDGEALMALQIDLDSTGASARRRITCLVQEDSRQARSRIGRRVMVLEHPDDPQLHALDGHQPNGRKRVVERP